MGLPPALLRFPFAQPERARTNLTLLAEHLAPQLLDLLPSILGQVPDPDGSLNTLERFTRALPSRVAAAVDHQPVLLHYLLALFSYSHFLSETLVQHPELLVWLGREKNLERLKSREELLEEYARFESTALEADPALSLARFKRRQVLRITLKDVLGLATLMETTLELSLLADVLLEKALMLAEKELRRAYGSPQTQDSHGRPVPARFAILSLGKLGGSELNYSSDVDLLFLFAGEGETVSTDPERRISNREFFLRVGQRVVQLIAGATREGAVFRVDMRLRPGGGEGDLVASLPGALTYYQRQAREWELQMLLKARHSAGDERLVGEFLAGAEPLLYRGSMHFAAIESVLQSRERLDRKLDADQTGRLNVKLAPGGIRDVEFLVQCLQRLHGREDRWVRAGGTLAGLQKLYEKRYLAARDHFHLASAYEFLRRVEHRLQLEHGEQTHTLPADPASLKLLAARCGVSSQQEFERLLREHLRRVQAISGRVLPRKPQEFEMEAFALRHLETGTAQEDLRFDQLLTRLRKHGSPFDPSVLKEDLPVRVRQGLRRLLAAAISSSEAFEEAQRASDALPFAVEVLRLSEPLAALLVRRPERLARLQELQQTPRVSERQAALGLRTTATAAPLGQLATLLDIEKSRSGQMSALRRWFSDEVFSWGAKQVCLRPPVSLGVRDYTATVEATIAAGLELAGRDLGVSADSPFNPTVIALGRLGMGEVDLGSDVDLIFVGPGGEAGGEGRRLAERCIHILSAYTRDGTILPVDIRLRPRGSEGELVQTADSILKYFAAAAEVWEAATYLKAWPVAGNLSLGNEFCGRLQKVLRERFADGTRVRAALRDMRLRLEEESARSLEDRDNFKTGPGGMYDLDFLFSAAALADGARPMAGLGLVGQVELVGHLGPERQARLREAARLFSTVDHAIRLATGKGTARLPIGPRGEAAAELASGWLGEEISPARLAERLAATRREVRAVFHEVFR